MLNKSTVFYKAFSIDDLYFLVFKGIDNKVCETMMNSSEIKNSNLQIEDIKLGDIEIRNYLNGVEVWILHFL